MHRVIGKGTLALLFLGAGCVGDSDAPAQSQGNATLGIVSFDTDDTASKTTVVGRDGAGYEVGRLELTHGPFTLSKAFEDISDNPDVDGRKLEVSLKGQPRARFETVGYRPLLHMPAPPAGDEDLVAFLEDPHVKRVLDTWQLGYERSASDEVGYHYGTYSGTISTCSTDTCGMLPATHASATINMCGGANNAFQGSKALYGQAYTLAQCCPGTTELNYWAVKVCPLYSGNSCTSDANCGGQAGSCQNSCTTVDTNHRRGQSCATASDCGTGGVCSSTTKACAGLNPYTNGTNWLKANPACQAASSVFYHADAACGIAATTDSVPLLAYGVNTTDINHSYTGVRTLTISPTTKGTVTSSVIGIQCKTGSSYTDNCSTWYTNNTSVTLTATPVTDYVFDHWTGDCSGTTTCTLSMTANKSATPVYAASGGACGTGCFMNENGCCQDNNTCFVAGTQITMADGTTRGIETIAVGDEIMAYDEQLERTVPSHVTHTFVHENHEGTVLVNGRVQATPNHPFYANGKWVRADELQDGDQLMSIDTTAKNGATAMAVSSLSSMSGGQTVFNLEVDTQHTYFAGGLLVHNKLPVCDCEL